MIFFLSEFANLLIYLLKLSMKDKRFTQGSGYVTVDKTVHSLPGLESCRW